MLLLTGSTPYIILFFKLVTKQYLKHPDLSSLNNIRYLRFIIKMHYSVQVGNLQLLSLM